MATFGTLSDRLTDTFRNLRKKGQLTPADVDGTVREIRRALLDADVALPVVKDFVARVRERALGAEVTDSVSPGQQVIKIVQDVLTEALGGEGYVPLNLDRPAPIPILMVGLQGSGKTTTSGKIALRLLRRERKRVLLASLDTQRPAAQLQLAQLAERAGVSRKWIYEFEAGKPTAEFGLLLSVLDELGLALELTPRPETDPSARGDTVDLDALLDEHRGP